MLLCHIVLLYQSLWQYQLSMTWAQPQDVYWSTVSWRIKVLLLPQVDSFTAKICNGPHHFWRLGPISHLIVNKHVPKALINIQNRRPAKLRWPDSCFARNQVRGHEGSHPHVLTSTLLKKHWVWVPGTYQHLVLSLFCRALSLLYLPNSLALINAAGRYQWQSSATQEDKPNCFVTSAF